MKWLYSNGRTLVVRDVGPVLMELRAAGVPLRCRDEVLDDEVARERLREILATGLYQKGGAEETTPEPADK